VRWLPAISMMLVSVISYIDRNTLALLAPTILRETNLSAEQYGSTGPCCRAARNLRIPCPRASPSYTGAAASGAGVRVDRRTIFLSLPLCRRSPGLLQNAFYLCAVLFE
jgi:hypothetical protein